MVNYPNFSVVATLVDYWPAHRQETHLREFLPPLEREYDKLSECMAEYVEKGLDLETLQDMLLDHQRAGSVIRQATRLLAEADRFKLANDPPRVRPAEFDNNLRTRQRKLIDGMDCLPGQLDLF